MSPAPRSPRRSRAASRVTALDSLERDPSLIRVAIDGASVGTMLRAAVESMKLRVDGPVSPALAAKIRWAIDVAAARTRALRMLASQDRSAQRLVDLLVARGVSPPVAEEAVRGLRADGWVDDARFAAQKARTLVERHLASHELVADSLAREGLEADLAASTARRVAPRRDDLARAVELARRSLRSTASTAVAKKKKGGGQAATVRRVASALARGGFEADTIATALERVGLRLEPEGDS